MTPERRGTDLDSGLEVLVSVNCIGCAQALALVEQFRTSHPQVPVRITDVDQPGWGAPAGFVGTPMYLTGGRILWLGNPSAEDLSDAFPQGGP